MTDEKKDSLSKATIKPGTEYPPGRPGRTGKKSSLEPDPETLHVTDPQEEMEGPISSIMQTIKEEGEASDVVTKEEADKKKDENI